MKTALLLALSVLFATPSTSGQDRQHCQSDGAGSFQQVKDSVCQVTTMHGYSGLNEKSFSRFGDMVSVAILQSLNDDEMTTSQTLRDVLLIVRLAFACPSRCVIVPDDREPRVTLAVNDTQTFVLQSGAEPRIVHSLSA